MPTTRDYYEVLSVERTADGEEIKRYRRLAMKYHPDRNPGDTEAEQRFKEAARPTRSQRRQQTPRYDQYGHEGLKGQGSGRARLHTHERRGHLLDVQRHLRRRRRRVRQRTRRWRPARGYDLETKSPSRSTTSSQAARKTSSSQSSTSAQRVQVRAQSPAHRRHVQHLRRPRTRQQAGFRRHVPHGHRLSGLPRAGKIVKEHCAIAAAKDESPRSVR